MTIDTDYFSVKCRRLSLFGAFAVVGLHSTTAMWVTDVVDWVTKLQAFVASHLRFAVPLFLVFSGYWFVKSYRRYGYLDFLKRKFWSLYVPFVLCCVIGEIVVWMSSFWSHTEPSFRSLLYVPFLVTKGLNLAFHLWYVRALLLIFIAAPFCYCVARSKFLLLGLLVFTRFWPVVEVGPYCFQCVATVIPYFFIGALLSDGNKLAIRTSRKLGIVAVAMSAIGLAILDLCPEWEVRHVLNSQEIRTFLCVLLVWFGYDVLPKSQTCGGWLKYSFFVYIIHVLTIRFSGNVLRYLNDPMSPSVRLTGYIINWATFFLDVGLGVLCAKHVPRLYRILSGGR